GRVRAYDWRYREVTPLDLTKVYELGSVESPPIKDIVRETLKPSQNLFAQLLLLQTAVSGDRLRREGAGASAEASKPHVSGPELQASGQDSGPGSERTTEEIGIEMMNDFLDKAGVKKGDVLLEEGSGLSRRDVITPNATVALLAFMNHHR